MATGVRRQAFVGQSDTSERRLPHQFFPVVGSSASGNAVHTGRGKGQGHVATAARYGQISQWLTRVLGRSGQLQEGFLAGLTWFYTGQHLQGTNWKIQLLLSENGPAA